MRIGGVPGLGASIALAAVTLGVFGVLQNYGPESAVRRFHHAVATGDPKELAETIVGDTRSSSVTDLGTIVHAFLLENPQGFHIVQQSRTDKQVEILALYGSGRRIVWVVVKARDRWRVDPYLTLQGMQRLGIQ